MQGRTENQIKNRFYSTIRKIAKEYKTPEDLKKDKDTDFTKQTGGAHNSLFNLILKNQESPEIKKIIENLPKQKSKQNKNKQKRKKEQQNEIIQLKTTLISQELLGNIIENKQKLLIQEKQDSPANKIQQFAGLFQHQLGNEFPPDNEEEQYEMKISFLATTIFNLNEMISRVKQLRFAQTQITPPVQSLKCSSYQSQQNDVKEINYAKNFDDFIFSELDFQKPQQPSRKAISDKEKLQVNEEMPPPLSPNSRKIPDDTSSSKFKQIFGNILESPNISMKKVKLMLNSSSSSKKRQANIFLVDQPLISGKNLISDKLLNSQESDQKGHSKLNFSTFMVDEKIHDKNQITNREILSQIDHENLMFEF